MGTIVRVNSSKGGVPKLPLPEGRVGQLGLEGDDHADKVNHGGAERALCLYSMERIEALQAEGHPIAPGTAGENVTIRGLDWDEIAAGTRLRLGSEVVIEVTRDTTPCATIEASFLGGDFTRISHKAYPGWSRVYARVLSPGVIRPGDEVSRED